MTYTAIALLCVPLAVVLDHATRPVAVVPLGVKAAPERAADVPTWAPTF